MKRLLPLLAALLLLSACAAQPKPAQTTVPPALTTTAATTVPPTDTGTQTLTLLAYGTPSEGQMDALSDALTAVGLPMTVQAIALDPSTTTAMIRSYASGLPKADIAVFYDYSMLAQMYEKGLLLDLAPYQDAYPLLFSTVSDADWTSVRQGSALMGYPLPDPAMSLQRHSSVMLRSDILEQLGMDPPTSPEELLDLCILARDAGLPCDLVVGVLPPYAFHRTYDAWPFFVSDNSLVLIGQDGVAQSYPDSDIFRKDMELYARFREAGVLRGVYNDDSFFSEWDALAALSGSCSEDCPYWDDLILVQFEPDRGNMQISSNVVRFVGVSAAADPEIALCFLEALYTEQDVYDALAYGVEGQDWTLQADGTVAMKQVNPFGRHFTASFMEHLPETVITARFGADTLLSFNPGAYNYNPDLNALTSVYRCKGFIQPSSGILYIRDGSLPQELLPQALSALHTAGLDKVVQAYQDGYDAVRGS